MEYRSEADKCYYSSDLSKWIDINCTHEMTSINMDIVQHKKSINEVRFIEYKHSNEGMKKGQEDLLKLLSKIKPTYIIRGDYPYEKTTIERISDKVIITVTADELRQFLNFILVTIEDILLVRELNNGL